MSAEKNIEIVQSYLAARGRGDLDAALEYIADDFSQRLMFQMPDNPGEWHGKEGLRAFVSNIRRLFPDGSTVTVERIWGSEDAVIAETINSGHTNNDLDYSNKYCYIYEITDGKISAVREYADSYYARTVLAS